MATKTVYQADAATRVYLYPMTAHELPFAPGFFSIPYSAYEDTPPDVPVGQVVQRNVDGTAWDGVEDHRSDVFYVVASAARYDMGSVVEVDGEQLSYAGLGGIPAWLTLTAPKALDQ